jgi:hypothetical protein
MQTFSAAISAAAALLALGTEAVRFLRERNERRNREGADDEN